MSRAVLAVAPRPSPATSGSDVVRFMCLFPEFRAASWDGWRAHLGRLTPEVLEAFFVVGRGGGKSRITAMLGACHATRRYKRAQGEAVTIAIIAPSRGQALITFRYLRALLRSTPVLAALIVREASDSITLSTGCVIEVISATAWSPRGRSFGCVILEEAAFFDSDATSANPDLEIVRAVRPGLARVPGSRLIVVSSPFAERGLLWEAAQKYESAADPEVLFVRAPTLTLNPLFDRRAIERAYREDPISAAAEYGAEFRSDGAGLFLSRAAIHACVVKGRRELAPVAGRHYHAFVDLAGGAGGDAATLAIAHSETRKDGAVAVLDVVREVVPPFSTSDVCAEFSRVAQAYGVALVIGDRFGSEFARDAMSAAGVTLWPADRSKSDLYLELLPAVNSRRAELLDLERLHTQLSGLQRRPGRSGREHVDHPVGQHDDVANAVAGAVAEALAAPQAGGVGQALTHRKQANAEVIAAAAGPPRQTFVELMGITKAARR